MNSDEHYRSVMLQCPQSNANNDCFDQSSGAVYLFFYLFCLFIYLFVYLFICLFIYLFIHFVFIYLSIYLFIYLFIYLSIYLFILSLLYFGKNYTIVIEIIIQFTTFILL